VLQRRNGSPRPPGSARRHGGCASSPARRGLGPEAHGFRTPEMDAAAPPGIDYAGLLRAALLGVVREALARAAREGLPG
jgi:hypothetical protein